MVEEKRVCGLISGGKDSNYAFYKALQEGYKPACILSISPLRSDSWMFHTPYTNLVKLQAEAMGFENLYYEFKVSGVKEAEVVELYNILKNLKIKTNFNIISVGAIASRYQYKRISTIAEKLGVEIYAPQWLKDPKEYMLQLINEKFKFILIQISVYGLPPTYLGKIIDIEDVKNIIELSKKYGFNPAFEGGEAETLVVDAPHFHKKIKVFGEPVKLGPYEWIYKINNVYLENK